MKVEAPAVSCIQPMGVPGTEVLTNLKVPPVLLPAVAVGVEVGRVVVVGIVVGLVVVGAMELAGAAEVGATVVVDGALVVDVGEVV